MKRLAIVGHPSSGYEEVRTLLQQSGMAAARPSRREGLLPEDINATLMKAHEAPGVSAVLEEDGFAPLETGAVWHGMALDLMLGNLDEPLWGWADPHAIYALDYWKELDPNLKFVLVYDEPHRAVMDAAAQGEPLSAQDVDRLLDNWAAYNGALLKFYLRHQTRSVLVHAQQARRAAGPYLQRLRLLLDAPLSLPDLRWGSQLAGNALPALDAPLLPAGLERVVAKAGANPERARAVLAAGAAERYLVNEMLGNHHRALKLHEEMQSVADLPLDREAGAAARAASAWESLITQRSFVTNLLAEIHAQYQRASDELDDARTARNRLSEQLRQLQQAQDSAKAKAVDHDKKLQDLGAENELLLTQLHRVQEELEQLFLRKQELEQREARSAARNEAATERISSLIERLKNAKQRFRIESAEQAERVRQQIPYRLGEVVLRHGRSPLGWFVLPFALIRVARAYRKERQEQAA